MIQRDDIVINLPRFDYLCQKNTYSGSQGEFRYKFFPRKVDDIETVFVAAVYYHNCYEVELEAGRVEEATFEYSNDGIDEAEQYLLSKFLEQ